MAEEGRDFNYLDLSDSEASNLLRSTSVSKYVTGHGKQLTVLDEVQTYPGLFQELLSIIDRRRRAGKGNGSFLLLGSSCLELANRSRETLTGRIGYVDLDPIDIMEITSPVDIEKLWLRGGLPASYTADNDDQAFAPLRNLIHRLSRQELLEQGVQLTRDKIFKLLLGLANQHGSQLNKREIASQIALDWHAVDNCVGKLTDLLVARELPAYTKAAVKNFDKRPRIYYRDSGLLHQLLELSNMTALSKSHMKERSWKGFVIENILRQTGYEVESSYFRTRKGKSEMDLILGFQTGPVWAIGIKKGTPDVGRNFYTARDRIEPDRCFIVHGLSDLSRNKDKQGVEIISLPEICCEVAEAAKIL